MAPKDKLKSNDKVKTFRFQDALDDKDVEYHSEIIKGLKTYLPQISNGLVGVRNIDIFAVDEPIKVLLTGNNSVDYL